MSEVWNPAQSPFLRSTQAEPHIGRTRQILTAHPELKKLFGNEPLSIFYILGLVALQTVMSFLVKDQSGWIVLLAAYAVGAVANHALFVLIHEATHNLIFRSSNLNKLSGILANFPIVFPAAISFRKYHLIHHRYQGDMDLDADLPGPVESRIIGNSTWRKAVWLSFFFVVYGLVRPARLKRVKLWDGWTLLNFAVEFSFLGAITYFAGWKGLVYLALSSCFSIGLHPLGGRWIQEHFVLHETQETYSYYGSLNRVMFNVGFHNEHHDLMMVPWSKLPKVKAMAPEFYDSLYSHSSYLALLWRFITDPKIGLHSRVVRPGKAAKTAAGAKALRDDSRMNAQAAERDAAAGMYGAV